MIGTMVFDEIDTGISGHISAVVAEKMCNISRARQVIAITHMPSLAAMADSHFLIAKSVEGGKTLTHLTLLRTTRTKSRASSAATTIPRMRCRTPKR